MKTTVKLDVYSKIVLTVIAIALCTLVFQNAKLTTPAYASAPLVAPPVTSIAEESQKQTKPKKEVIDVNIVQVDGKKVLWGGAAGGLPVRVTNK